MKYLIFLLFPGMLMAQGKRQVTLKISPDPVQLTVGETVKPVVKAFDASGNELPETSLVFLGFGSSALRATGFVPARGARLDSLGVHGLEPGSFTGTVIRPGNDQDQFARGYFKIEVTNAPVKEVKVDLPENLYSGTSVPMSVEVVDEAGFVFDRSMIMLESSDGSVAMVDAGGNLRLTGPGKASIVTKTGGVTHNTPITVLENPVREVALTASATSARTGDVIHLTAKTFDSKGNNVQVPVFFALAGGTGYQGAGASAIISPDGRFVGEEPGLYRVIATSGNVSDMVSLTIAARDVAREIEFVGHGTISESHTGDFWVWEGVDGRDYAVTGTHLAGGKAFFWDVTNPANIFKIDSLQVDARSVNDVKVSPDGKICVISREGASNRKNGFIILDVTDPHDVKQLSTYTENLTGGVHNLFIYEDHVFALSAGQKYEIVNISDPTKPYRVSKFEIDNPVRSIHDVWVVDGIAYSSNWSDGVIMVDVGNGIAGGSPENPVEITRFQTEGNANHTAFPYNSSTGRKYVVAGDEIFPLEFQLGTIIRPRGYIHFIDVTDPENPVEVASYKVPEAGAHNFWVEDDMLYIGYYQGGLRVVDISGELMGDLYKQGREIGHYMPFDEKGFIPNTAMTWGAQPYKGHVFFADFNSGLWSAKVKPVKPKETQVETR